MKIDAVQLAGILSYVAKAADVDTADSLAAHIAALEKERDGATAQAASLRKQLDGALQAVLSAQNDRAVALADNAALVKHMDDNWHLSWCKRHVDKACACSDGCPLAAILSAPHPGAALLEEVEALRQQKTLWEEAATALYGYAEFIGPCAHGRDPWDRCDECGEGTSVAAAQKVINKMAEEHRKALVRARNDGLQKAARETDAEADEWDGAAAHDGDPVSHEANAIRGAARRIRALKEPES